jgi:AAA+ ATPase superfamily predicted ATPase
MSITPQEADQLIETIQDKKDFNDQEFQKIIASLIRRALTARVIIDQGGNHLIAFHINFTKASSGLARALALNKDYKETLLFILRLTSQMNKINVEEIIEEIGSICFRFSLMGHPLFIFVVDTPIQQKEMIIDAFQDSYISDSQGLRDFLLPNIQEKKKIDPRENALQILKRLGSGKYGCPYAYLGPCRPDMFFGREKLLREILLDSQQGFAITGGRRIGKSSVLLKLKDMVERGQYPQVPYFPLVIDCAMFNTYYKLLDEVTRLLLPELYYKIINKQIKSSNYSFDYVLSRSSVLKAKPILLLLDEVDSLINNIKQTNDPLFEDLRIAVNKKIVKLVIAGFREIYDVVSSYKHPSFNLCEKKQLGVLSESDVNKLLTIPFRAVKISFESKEQLIKEIFHKTSGHPSFVQFVAKQLFLRRKNNVIRRVDFHNLLDERLLIDHVLDHFLMNTNEAERQICLTMIDYNFITLQNVKKVFQSQKRYTFNEAKIHKALTNLMMNSILIPEKNAYRFLNPLVVSVIKENITN